MDRVSLFLFKYLNGFLFLGLFLPQKVFLKSKHITIVKHQTNTIEIIQYTIDYSAKKLVY